MPKEKTIDLNSLDTAQACAKGFELELVHPITKAPLGQFISVVGKDSPQFKEHTRRIANERLRKNALLQRRGKDGEIPTVEQIEGEAIELLVCCTTGFRNVNYGGPFEFSEANVRKLYTEQAWVRGQVDEAIGDLENFMSA
jgi:hypothetical protein